MSTAPDITRLIASATGAEGKRLRRRAEASLAAAPDAQAVPALIAALRDASSKREFQRIARLVATRNSVECIEELARQARENRRFQRLPVRALAESSHPSATLALLEIMQHGRARQRASAMIALGQQNAVAAIEPLCRIVADRKHPLAARALHVLQRMGKPDKLALRALQDASLSDAACARILHSMRVLPVYLFPLAYRPFDGEKQLAWLAGRKNTLAPRAACVLDRLRDQRLLLRASQASGSDTLLRPSGGTAAARPEELLRAAGAPMGEESPAGWWQSLLSRVRRP